MDSDLLQYVHELDIIYHNEVMRRVILRCGQAILEEALSIRPSILQSISISQEVETSVLDCFCVCVFGRSRCGWGFILLPTRQRRYCNPASLVLVLT